MISKDEKETKHPVGFDSTFLFATGSGLKEYSLFHSFANRRMVLVSGMFLLVFILFCHTQIRSQVLYNSIHDSCSSSILLLYPRIMGRSMHVFSEFGNSVSLTEYNYSDDYSTDSTVIGNEYSSLSLYGSRYNVSSVFPNGNSTHSIISASSGSTKANAEIILPTVASVSTMKPTIDIVEHTAESTLDSPVHYPSPNLTSIPISTPRPTIPPSLPTVPVQSSQQNNMDTQSTVSHSSSKKPRVKEIYYDWGDSVSQYSMIS